MIELPSPKILTVTEITKSIKGLLEIEFSFVTVVGEISNLRQPYSGHLYFTLKDEGAQLKAVMFKQQQRYLTAKPQDGKQVICRGRLSVYEPRGEYQLIIDFIEFKGTGALQIVFEHLKRQLAAEGLFDVIHKKKIPILPSRVAVVTSPIGAALFDFLRKASFRFPSFPIEIFPVRVQGDEAVNDIVDAITLLNKRQSSDVIVICRGGGSLEDLWAFNEEKIARAIYASDIPVVTAIGHEIDFTIADFVADHRSPTPTAAAEEVIPEQRQLRETISQFEQRLIKDIYLKIESCVKRVHLLERMLGDPRSKLTHFMLLLDHSQTSLQHSFVNLLSSYRSRVDVLITRLHYQCPIQQITYHRRWIEARMRQLKIMMNAYLERKRAELQRTMSLLDAVSPFAVLNRGYSLVRSLPEGELIRSSKQTTVGQSLEVILQEGVIECEVRTILDG